MPDAVKVGFVPLSAAARGILVVFCDDALKFGEAARKALHVNGVMQFNCRVNAVVAGVLLSLVIVILLLSVREWILLLARKRIATLYESEPVWLPAYEAAHENPLRIFGLFALAFALAKELSGESAVERARIETAKACECGSAEHQQLYVAITTRRYKGVNRCC